MSTTHSGNGNGPATRKLDRATTYVNLGLTLTLVIGALKLGLDMGQQREKLEQVPTRYEVELIAARAVIPLQQEIAEVKARLSVIEERTRPRGGE